MVFIKKRNSSYSVIYTFNDKNGNKKQKWEMFNTLEQATKRKWELENHLTFS